MAVNTVGALRHVGWATAMICLNFAERSVGKGSFAKCFKGGALIGR